MLTFAQGRQFTLTFRFRDQTDKPVDLSNYSVLNFCMLKADGTTHLHKKRVLITGNTSSGSPVVTSTDTSQMEVGDLVAGANIPLGTKVLTVDSETQFTMTGNATSTVATEALTIGDVVFNGSPLLGETNAVITSVDSGDLPIDQPIDVQCNTVDGSSLPNSVQFLGAFQLTGSIC